MNFFISDAMAQSAGEGGGIITFLPMIVLMVIFYFLLIRPQQKRQKQHKEMLTSIAKGDEVVTMGGLLGKVVDLNDNFMTLEIAKGTNVKVQRSLVQAMMPKGTMKDA
jgi:preprotein translocase subunit YajC